MNYLQEHFNELQGKRGIVFCYHDKMVEMQDMENLHKDTFKNVVSIEKECIAKITEEKEYNYGTYTRPKYSLYDLRNNNQCEFIIKGLDDFQNDFPYFPLQEILDERDYWYNTPLRMAQIICLAVKYPQIELLWKTNFKKFVKEWVSNSQDTRFSRSFKNGKNMEEITQLPKYAWQMLVERAQTMKEYNEMRIWVQKENLSKEQLEMVFDLNLRKPELEKVRKLCMKKWENKNLYTLDTLLNYLQRCDTYQAIYSYDAIEILFDYIKMSLDMGVEPITNSNSLKREHDVMARNYNQWYRAHRDSKTESAFINRSEQLQKYEFENDKYIIRTPRNVQELLDEGNNQRNCIACYTSSYANGRAQIFFMRKKDQPNKSYISIELNQDLTQFRQVYYACNRPVENQQELAFLNKWLEHIKTINQ